MKKEIKFIDPQLNFKKKSIQDRLQYINSTKIPLPSEVEISESGMCNRKCSFCPRSDPDFNHVNEFINEKLHKKICDELSELNFSGLFIYSGFVEPLLDKNIYNEMLVQKDSLQKSIFIYLTTSVLLTLGVFRFINGVLDFLKWCKDKKINCINGS